MARQPEPAVDQRPECPMCGSRRTQPFTHAGPGARVNTKCLACGQLFKVNKLAR